MDNQENKVEGTETTEGQQVVQQTTQAEAPKQEAVPKETFGAKVKRHKKGLIAAALALFGVGGSAYVAYKKGKAAGINSIPMPQEPAEDYSLNPNE